MVSSSSSSTTKSTRRRSHQQLSSKTTSSTVTGYDGFDRYYEEFSSLIEKLEQSLKVQDEETTSELLREAKENILPAMAVERRSISSSRRRKHPGLKQHLSQVYEACQMQLQTYQSLSEQPPELFRGLPKDDGNRPTTSLARTQNTQNPKHAKISSYSSSSSSSPPSSFEASKETLFAGSNTSNSSSSSSNSHYKTSIQARTQGRVMEQNSQLESAMRSIRESEQIASETIEELQSQRTTLESSSTKMKDLSTMTDQAKQLVKSMNRPWWTKW